MRLALHSTGEVGRRAGRILLAEADLAALGIYGRRSPATEDRRTTAITALTGFSVLATDDATAPLDLAGIAVADGLSCVIGADVEPPPVLAARFAAAGLSLLVAASLPGLAEAFACYEAPGSPPGEVLLAWTRQGKPGRGRRGRLAVPFPDPVGARWGTRLPPRPGEASTTIRAETILPGPWGAALARVTTPQGRTATARLVATADDSRHLEAIALAAGALLAARGGAPPGASRPGAAASAYLHTCFALGLAAAGLGGRGTPGSGSNRR